LARNTVEFLASGAGESRFRWSLRYLRRFVNGDGSGFVREQAVTNSEERPFDEQGANDSKHDRGRVLGNREGRPSHGVRKKT